VPTVTPLLVFLHLPKASGTTLSSIIERQYPAGTVYRSTETQPQAVAQAIGHRGAAAPPLRCVMGHMLFGLHRYLDGPTRYITMLRHPIRRLLSHYAYVLRTPEHYLHAEVVGGRLTFDEYVAGGLSSELNDGQVRLLCGREDAEAVPFGLVSEEMLVEAEANLRTSFVAVGITERFDESLRLFRTLLGWRDVAYEAQNRSAPSAVPTAVSATTTALIGRYNRLDLRLYERACRMLDDALAVHRIDASASRLARARNLPSRLVSRARTLAARPLRAVRRMTR
jgi:hypothetical protein